MKSDRKRDPISFETRQAMMGGVRAGEKVAAIAPDMGRNLSTIATIWSDRKRILKHIDSVVPMKSTIISKRRGQVLEKTEKLSEDDDVISSRAWAYCVTTLPSPQAFAVILKGEYTACCTKLIIVLVK